MDYKTRDRPALIDAIAACIGSGGFLVELVSQDGTTDRTLIGSLKRVGDAMVIPDQELEVAVRHEIEEIRIVCEPDGRFLGIDLYGGGTRFPIARELYNTNVIARLITWLLQFDYLTIPPLVHAIRYILEV